MEPRELETRMREAERFRAIRIDPEAWTIIRLDGRAFTGFCAQRFVKPFDERLRDHMLEAAVALLDDFEGVYGYTFSDEISIAFRPGLKLFDGRLEKLVSVSAGLVSSVFTQACGAPAHFDSRVWQGRQKEEVIAYFRWRQADAARCALNGWCYWTLRDNGVTSRDAVELLANKGKAQQQRLLGRYDIDYARLPLWQKRGVGLRWAHYRKPGYDPLRHQPVAAWRRRIVRDEELPAGEAYSRYLEELLSGPSESRSC